MWCEAWVKRLYSLMEAFLATAALLLATAVAGGGELRINVQSFPPGQALKPGVAVLLSVEGLEPGQEATWHRVAVEGDVVLKLDHYHLFAGTASGPRTFIVQVAAPGADPFAITSFNYGTGPDPPDPPVPPVPPGEKLVVIVHESLNPTAAETTVIARLLLWLTQHGQPYRLFDPQQTEADKTPPWAKAVLDRNQKEPLLAVVTGDDAGGYSVVGAEPLPGTIEGAIEWLGKWGVK